MSNALTRAFGAVTRFVNGLTRRDDPMRYVQGAYLRQQFAGVTVSMDSALCISVVWACVMAITNAVSRCPWHVYGRKGDKREQLPDDPLAYLLNVRPNPEMTAIAFREVMCIGALTYGNSYAEVQRDLANRVVGLWPLMPHRMQVLRDAPEAGGALYYLYAQMDGGLKRLEVDEVFHLHGPGVTGLLGDNLVARAVQAMGLAAAQERFASTYFGNNTHIGGFLELPPGKKLKDPDLEKLRNQWADRYAGPSKAHKPAILEDGMTWKAHDVKASDAQLVESRKFSLEEVCRFFGVPPHKAMHLENAHFANIEQQNIEFVGDGVEPWCLRLTQEADYKLLSDRGARRMTKLDTSRLLMGDFKSRMEGYQVGRRIGVYSANDIRAKEEDNPIGPQGDVYLVEANMVTLERVSYATEPEITKDDVVAGVVTKDERREQLGLKALPGGQGAEPVALPAPGGGSGGGGAPGGGDGTQPSKDAPAKGAQAVLDSVTALLEGTFGRYQRRLEHRAADLRRAKVTPAQAELNLARERIQLRSWVVEDAAPALALASKHRPTAAADELKDAVGAVVRAVDELDNGSAALSTAYALARNLLEAR